MELESDPVIAVDGPAGVGKGTLAISLAEHLKFHYLDSGALYRILAYEGSHRHFSIDDTAPWVDLAATLSIQFLSDQGYQACVNGHSIEANIRNEECAQLASQLAANPRVREALLGLQRRFLDHPGLIAEGRDMGTIVFPDAPLKIFLTASQDARASRRYKQLKGKGINASFDNLLDSICARDRRDQERKVAPLTAATDAVVIDTTHLSAAEVLEQVLSLSKQRHITD